MNKFKVVLNSEEIKKIIPHRDKALLIDGVEIFGSGDMANAICHLGLRAHLFDGHFPGDPILPGIFIQEAMAQTGAVMVLYSNLELRNERFLFSGVESVKYRGIVRPNSVLFFTVNLVHLKKASKPFAAKFSAEAIIDDKKVASAVFSGIMP